MRLPFVLILVALVNWTRADTATLPEVTQLIPAQSLGAGSGAALIDLGNFFDVAGVSGQVVQMATGYGKINVEILSEAAPNTVANFLTYVNSGAYANTLFHRSVSGFVLQAGGYFIDNNLVTPVETNDPVANEFNLSNVRGTLAMAKVSGDPDSATSQWFFNLADNSANLDSQNGGFTVFARVIGTGMTVADAIAALPIYDVSGILGSDFTQTPLQNVQNNQAQLYISNLVTVSSAQVVPICPAAPGGPSVLSFSVESTNATAAPASVSGRMLSLPKAASTAAITVRAEDSNGNSAESTFMVGATGVTVGPGQAAVFRVANTASTFQWQRLPSGGKIWADIHDGDGYTGTATAVLAVPANLAASGDQYHCTVTTAGKPKASVAQLLTVQTLATVVLHQTGSASIAGAGAVPGTTYFAKGLPTGLTINASTGQVTGKTTAKPGIYAVTTWSQSGSTKSAVSTRTIVVQAFVPLMTGSFEGVFISSGGVPVGKVTVLVSASGAFTGQLTYGSGFVGALKGALVLDAFNSSGTANIAISGGATLAIAVSRAGVLTGSLTIPSTPVEVDTLTGGVRVISYGSASPAPWRGSYAMALGDVYNYGTLSCPSGAGHAVAMIASTGVMSLRGTLSDGTLFTGSFPTDANATYRPWISPYKRGWSYAAGFLPLSPRVGQTSTYDVAVGQGQDFYWAKNPGTTDKIYPSGFGWLGLNLSVEPWSPPADVASLATKLGLGSGRTLTLLVSCEKVTAVVSNVPTVASVLSNQDPNNTYGLPVTVTLSGSGKVVTLAGSGTSSITAKVNLADGSFTGTMSLAANGSVPARVVPIEGTLQQLVSPAATSTVGQGFFLLPGAAKTDPTLGGLIELSVPASTFDGSAQSQNPSQ